MRRFLLLCALGVALGVGLVNAAVAACLPDSLITRLANEYPGWKVVELPDFQADDQAILRRAHLEECPGVAMGRFDGKHDAYAVTLWRRGDLPRQMLVVLTPSSTRGVEKIEQISGPEEVATLSFVAQVPPGSVESVDGTKTSIKYDGVKLETLEVGVLIYYFDGHRYHSVLVSE